MNKTNIILLVAVIYILNIVTIDCLHCSGVAGVTSSNLVTMCTDRNITSRLFYLGSGPAYEDCLCRVTFWRMASRVRSRVDVRNLAAVNTTCDDKIIYKSSTLVQCTGANPWYWFPVGEGMSFDFIRRVGVKTDNNNMSFCLQVFGVPGSLLNVACWDPVDETTPSGATPKPTTTKTTTTTKPKAATDNAAEDGGSSTGAIIGVVVCLLIVVIVIVVFFVLKSKKQKVEAE